jgi:isopentenyl-diphosphate delta-isomerase
MLLPRLLGRVCLPAYLNSHLHLSRCMTTTASLDFTQYDSAQLAMMEEMCIVVDFDDAVIGEGTKKDVHLIDGVCMLPAGPPHRAFSVFLFDEQWRLLLQKRCSDKILFPLHWANTCCSHPLADGATFLGAPIHGEADGHRGTIRAARRKLHQELGIANEAVPEDAFRFVTKVHYKAPLPGPDPKWGEHEVDYILFCQRPRKVIEATLNLNPNEVVDTRWLTQEECKAFVDGADDPQGPSDNVVTHDEIISPWFGAIARELLHPWWEALKRGDINAVPPDGKIHRLAGGKEAMAGEPVGLVMPHKRESTRDK